MLSKWLKIADVARKEFAVDIIMAILSGLNNTTTYRLVKTRERLTASHKKRFDTLNELVNRERNFANRRRFTNSSTGTCLPYIGVCLVDLAFIQEGNRTFEAESNRINAHKLKVLSDCIADSLRWRAKPYNLTPVAALKQLLEPVEAITEEDLYGVSLYVEPRNGAAQPAVKPGALAVLANRFQTEAVIPNDEVTKTKSKPSFRSRSSDSTTSS
eukprot:TRINITY_DN2849_c0_g1_i1.p1 TRINITY_DN2849_c0_g1~~TRINITY_DN2849_c0_g1_i1.p1  ORF type:complete len:214 (-),score=20.10 TRINITY_DN2849_c0_g1_i1:56-697(-)